MLSTKFQQDPSDAAWGVAATDKKCTTKCTFWPIIKIFDHASHFKIWGAHLWVEAIILSYRLSKCDRPIMRYRRHKQTDRQTENLWRLVYRTSGVVPVGVMSIVLWRRIIILLRSFWAIDAWNRNTLSWDIACQTHRKFYLKHHFVNCYNSQMNCWTELMISKHFIGMSSICMYLLHCCIPFKFK